MEIGNRSQRSASAVTIACTFDDNFVPHFATCATSIAASRGGEGIHFILLAGPTLSSRAAAAVGDFVRDLGLSLEVVEPPSDALGALPSNRVFSPLVWYRLLLPGLLRDHDRVLSLDADTLVLQSLAPLFSTDLDDHLLAAVAEPPDPFGGNRPLSGLEPSRYFNAGIMMLNLAAMRDAQIGTRALAIGHERAAEFTFAEQDALNQVARGRWLKLHPKWNALSYLWVRPHLADDAYTAVELATARNSPAIVHFEGGHIVKPWYFRCRHPLRDLYRQYRALTPWPLERLERRSVSGSMLRRLPVRSQYAIVRYKLGMTQRFARR